MEEDFRVEGGAAVVLDKEGVVWELVEMGGESDEAGAFELREGAGDVVDCVVYYPFSVGAGALVGGFPRREGRGMGNTWKEKRMQGSRGGESSALSEDRGCWYMFTCRAETILE